jgi:hypothetical protein
MVQMPPTTNLDAKQTDTSRVPQYLESLQLLQWPCALDDTNGDKNLGHMLQLHS